VGGNLYVFRKVESHANFQPTKSPSKWCFLFSQPAHLIIIKLKMFQYFSKMLQHFFFNISSNFPSTFHKCSNIFLVNIFLEASSNIFLEISSNVFLEASSNFSSTFYKCSNIF
jgi:hypothetical protein